MSTLPTGTVTFLFTDIEGSTKLWESNPDAMRPALARHDALLRQAIEDHDGFVFKTVGDAFCAAFATAPEAVQAALTAQVATVAETWRTKTPLRVRFALHTGVAEERDGDYFGQPLNRVSRLLAAGHGGQTLLSLATQELTRDHLPPAASLLDLGQRRLKDLARPEHVFQLQHPALPNEFPPLRSLDNPDLPNNLPQQVSSFIGREKEMSDVKALLEKTRLLTLTGPGGGGKSRLALQVAADMLDGEGDGVWLIEFAALSDSALVPQAVADALGVREEAGKPLQRTLVDWLKQKRLLLILDNCEHLVAACASLAADLMRSCAGVHLLVSSREPLNVVGETVYRVPSLSLPDPKQTQTVGSLSQFEAVSLFVERARAVQTSFTVTDANAPAVAQVCWRLDGIPLAIELAAARVRSLSVEEVNARLDNRFRLLTGGSRTALPRQQTLRALIDWSYDLLTEPEKTTLRRLAVFAGGWTLTSAETVCAGDTVEDFEVVDLLTSLVDKSLVVYEGGGADAGRYRLLETVRRYADDRLQESGEADEVQGRAASGFLALAEEAEGQLQGPEGASWLERLETEHDNLRASLAWFEQSAEGAETGLRLSGALWRFWAVHGHFSEGRQWLGRALERIGGQEGGGTSALRARALNGAGNLASDQGDYAAAQALHEKSLLIRRRLGDQQGISASLNNLGNVASDQEDFATARALYEESLLIDRQLGDQAGIADALNNLGSVASDQRDYAAARALYEESLAIQRRLNGPGGIALTLGNLGVVAFEQGDYTQARILHRESLTIKRQLGDQRGIISGIEGLAGVAHGQNASSRAAQLLGSAEALRAAIGTPPPPGEQEEIAQRVISVRAALGEGAFSTAWALGRAMTLEQAIEYALAEE